MNVSLIQAIAAIAMVGVAFALVFAYRRYLAVNSERRMRAMLKSVGLDPAIATSGDMETIMKEVRQRCRSCASEDVCERWLAGNEEGDNAFCPNSKVFEELKKFSGAAR
jgi:hypothetical protein